MDTRHNKEVYPDTYKLKGLRQKLVTDLARKGITNPELLRALETVPRHAFLESAFAEKAYEDIAFPIANKQTISQPYTVAYQTQLLEPKVGKKVLEIGTGSGYQAAILCEMGLYVFSVERDPLLKTTATELLKQLGYQPTLLLGDGTQGWQRHAPYEAIVVTAGAPVVPESLCRQLTIGGRLVIPVGDRVSQRMMLIVREGEDSFTEHVLDSFRFVPLVGEYGWQRGL
jgi:protein-L-isoaspartate(D-aspartate) O-methyltransferase